MIFTIEIHPDPWSFAFGFVIGMVLIIILALTFPSKRSEDCPHKEES